MFNWVGNQLTTVLNTYVLNVVTALIAAITPIALSVMTIWVLMYGWAVLRNEVSDPLPAFVWKVFKIGLVLAVALQGSFYIGTVADTANDLAMGVATTFLPAGVSPTTVTTPYMLLDNFNDEASAQVADIMKNASMFRLDLVLAAVIFSIGSIVFLCIALFVVTLSKVFLSFVIAVGPLFVLCLAWRPTARFFDSWLSMVLNVVVLTWFAFFALGLSTFLGQQIFLAIKAGGGFLGVNFNVLGEAIRYCILMILMAIICFQAPSLASALTGGAAVQQGIQMIQNALMVAGLRSPSRSGLAGAAGAAGGTVRAGTGMAYAAGRATGATASAARNLASGAMGGRASTAANGSQVPAYKRAAMRGRSSNQ
ncbi:type IV secretion system protein [Roseateles sp. P5_D6]